MKNILKEKCFYFVLVLFLLTIGLLIFTHYEVNKNKELIGEIEYYDSLHNYHKVYYENSFNALKKTNKELYDSLKDYKDQISYLVQFTHEKEYNTGKISTKPHKVEKPNNIADSIPSSKTYEYVSEPNDTFQYKLKINSLTQPNWYSLSAKVKNKFTIVNKEDGNGGNHITISDGTTNGTISNVTVFKKKKSFWERFSAGPSITGGYDPINKQWGILAGASVTFDIK